MGQHRRPIPAASAASSSLPPWELEPVSASTATAAAFAAACAAKGGDIATVSEAGEVGESLNGASAGSQTNGQESSFSASLQQFLQDESPPDMPPPSREQAPAEVSDGENGGGLPTVTSVSSESDAVEFGTFGSTPSEWSVHNTPRGDRGHDHANASIEEELDEAGLSFDEPGQQVAQGGLGLGLSGSRGDLRMGAPGESAKVMAAKARRDVRGSGGGALRQQALPRPQQGGNGATVKSGRWKKGQLLGTGSFGQVYQGLNLDTGAMLAVKVLTVPGGGGGGHDASRKGQDVLEEIHQEIELMSSLSHVNIVQYLGAEMDARARELFIFQEYAAQPGCHVSPCIVM